MRTAFAKFLALLVLAAGYWLFVGRLSGVAEPWDADAYWRIWYPVSLALAAAAGPVFGRRGWLAGAAITFAQAPVMGVASGGGPWIVGLAMLFVLAVPAVALSATTGWLAARRTRAGQRRG